LEKINTPFAEQTLAGAAARTDPLVRRRATLAAGRLGEADAIPPLVDLICDGADDTGAAGVLASEFGLAEQVDRAVAGALEHAHPDQRLRLVGALTEIAGARSFERLAKLTRDADRRVALAARAALGSPA
jgi:HEAT repeat protein